MKRVVLTGMPNLGRGYLGALASVARPAPTDSTRLPATELVAEPVHIDAERVARYNSVCGLPVRTVAITYPFVFTFPLQLALMTRPDSPLRLPGLVHLGIDIAAHRALRAGMPYSASCAVARQAVTDRGLEFALAVTISDEAGVAWRAESRILARRPRADGAPRPARARPPAVTDAVLDEVVASGNVGRRYAQASGDWNPIHLGRLGARTLGFDRPIAHGMWTLARMVAAAGGPTPPCALSAEFIAPLRLPGRLLVRGDTRRLGAFDAANGRLVAVVDLKDIP